MRRLKALVGYGLLLAVILTNCKPATLTPDPSSSVPTRDNNLALGNPSEANTTDATN